MAMLDFLTGWGNEGWDLMAVDMRSTYEGEWDVGGCEGR